MPHAAVCFERRLPRLPRFAGRSGTLDVGHISLLTFFWAGTPDVQQESQSPAGAKSRLLREAQTSL